MKIALCYESMMPKAGGCETYIADLTRALVHDRHEVHLYACRIDNEAFPREVIHHVLPEPTGFRSRRVWKFASHCYAALQKETYDVSVGFIKTWGQDIIMPQGGFHLASAEHNVRKQSNPILRGIVRCLHAIDPRHRSYRALERKQLREFPSLLVVPSNMVREHGRQYHGLPNERMRVVHNAIDADRFPTHDRLLVRSQMRDDQQLHPEDNVGLFVGHNYRLKGLIPLLQAVKLLPREMNFKLLICGSAKYQRYARLADTLGISERVRFLGFHPEVREAFFASDFLIHPSFYDPCALVTMEALACGLSVITTKLNGGSELLPPGLASLTIESPHQHAAMAQQIIRLCDHEKRTALAREAREAAQRWTFHHHYQALLEVFREVAERKKPRVMAQRSG
jgi:UDP-glucose:(heptosyl)LPS alpha-1,3-glucosyltransferase